MTVLEAEETKTRARWSSAGVLALLVSAVLVAAATGASAFLGPRDAARDPYPWWPFVVLAVSVGVIITLITVARLHAFLALILAAIAAGLIARVGILPGEPARSHWTQAVELTTAGLGEVAGNIGVVIALASVIGMCLLESGAADKIVRRFLALFGEKRAGLALLISTYVVSIPIFFDTIFMLLVPIARALRLRTGRDYLLYLMAICCAGVITHSMIIPHPGPTAMARDLRIDEGLTIIVGLVTGLVPLAAGWLVCLWLNRRMDIPLVETPGATRAELEALMDRADSELPSLGASLLPVLLPVLLIALASFVTALWPSCPETLKGWLIFLGNRNIALLIGTAIGVALLMKQRHLDLGGVARLIGPPLETAGVIILITAAGGAFGYMLRNAGVGDAIKLAASGRQVNLILLAWLVAIIIRIAQGSATVAMLTTSSMMYPLIAAGLDFHPIYLFIAIGYGGMGVSWMNDSGFWVVSKLGGLTERETLRSWTVLLFVISLAGLLTAWAMSILLPFKPM